ncbi:hypothetical protein MYU51_001817 [Penicillium brevicompactum]|uniref:uncharacterized protein n=1 Tax=Penicillium brevicompactum TaxID=5074 RepID=UPI0025421A6F|nr:uncharacterized protein N7506_009811 [Penicillium brevicompactum]KAJ5326709.1 hypothetical protein N7506_009811 [Penicillium brevicompactum]
MSRCLRPGRILPFGRISTAARLPFIPYRTVLPFSRLTWNRHTRHSRHAERDLNYPDEVHFLRKYNGVAHPPLNHNQKKDINEWIRLLRKCTPSKSQKSSRPAGQPGSLQPLRASKNILDRTHALMGCCWDARVHYQFELIAHLGFELKDWSTVHSLLSSMIDTYELITPHMPPKQALSGLDWKRPYRVRHKNEPLPSPNSLDAKEPPLTERVTLSKLTGGIKGGSPWKFARLEHIPSPNNLSLDSLTVEPAARYFGDRILAEILANLGSLVLHSAESSSEQSQQAMSCVFRILARLHHTGMISDKVYQYPTPNPNHLVFRPPGLQLLSRPIMDVLSDAAWHEHEANVAAAAADAGELSPFIPYKMGIQELGPEIWLEFIMWCCVEHGFCKTGTLLAHQMTRMVTEQPWKAESWVPLIQDMDAVQQTNISVEQSWRRPGQDPKPQTSTRRKTPLLPFNGLGKKTISTEVVSSLRSGLTNKAYVGVGDHGYLLDDLFKLSAPLAKLIDPPTSTTGLRPTNMHTNWHTLRILNSGCLQPWTDPVAFESLLRSHSNVVPLWDGNGAETPDELEERSQEHFYNETAAFSGLIEYNLTYYARDKQSGRLFAEFAWLQNISDASKARHMQTFFDRLSEARTEEDLSFFDSGHVTPYPRGIIHQSSIPQVSNVTFANLLDVATLTHAFDFGRQLLLQDEMDGPAIPPGAYGSQALAPALLRFAVATKDASLGQKVISSLQVPLSVNTIKCLINYHISQQGWDRVEMMLKFLVDHRAKSWGYSNLATLASSVIRLEHILRQKTAAGTATQVDVDHVTCATDIMLRLYRGEWPASPDRPKVRFFQLRALSRMHRLLSTIPGPMPEIFKRLETPEEITGHHKLPLVPPQSFHEIFSAIVETQGAIVGKRVWDQHVIDWLSPKRSRQAPGGVSRLLFSDERNQDSGKPDWSPQWVNEIQKKSTLADLNTVRILARAAFREHAAMVKTQQDRKHAASNSGILDIDDWSSPSFSYDPTEPYVPSISRDQYPYQRTGGRPPKTELEAILDFCLETFLRFGLPEDQIDAEIPGHMRRMQNRGVFTYPLRKPVRQRIASNQNDPWIESSWEQPLDITEDPSH